MQAAAVAKNNFKAASGWSKMVPKSKQDKEEEKRKAKEDREKQERENSISYAPTKTTTRRSLSPRRSRIDTVQKDKQEKIERRQRSRSKESREKSVPRKPRRSLSSQASLGDTASLTSCGDSSHDQQPEPKVKDAPKKKKKKTPKSLRTRRKKKQLSIEDALKAEEQRLHMQIQAEQVSEQQREYDRENRQQAVKQYKEILMNPPTTKLKGGVVKVPKLSSLLARDLPDRQAYEQHVAEQRLNAWILNPKKCKILQNTFDGKSTAVEKQETIVVATIPRAIERFKHDPERYLAMIFVNVNENQGEEQEITFVLRAGTIGFQPQRLRKDNRGKLTILQHSFERLEPLPKNVLPKNSRDAFTDSFSFEGTRLHSSKSNKPILPGRGMGMGDCANMAVMGDYVEPNNVAMYNGKNLGLCNEWLLSAIACVAEYDWAIRRLFRKTKLLNGRPGDGPNQYVVTLWDLETWKQVDVVVDERLSVKSDGSGFLLGAKPSKSGKFWVPYLEKAIAAHCGGWDKLQGGACSVAWPMLTGSRNQYIISRNSKTDMHYCTARFNTMEQQWTDHTNSPQDSDQSVWKVSWPKVGGGGSSSTELAQDKLFLRMMAWNDNNFLIGAGTDPYAGSGSSDNHVFSVVDCKHDICDSGIDLVLIRNPLVTDEEFKNGRFSRHGEGWKQYPKVEKELNPVLEDNGLFWVTMEEFCQHFPTIYLCALDMTTLQDEHYANDLWDDIERETKRPESRPSRKVECVW
ncbi:MAG: hypothetical protein SGILL_000929 [Bacillariaceae sp.]